MEFNNTIDEASKGVIPKVTISTTISNETWKLAKAYNISWNTALEFGIAFFIAELDPSSDYPSCKLLDRMNHFRKLSEVLSGGSAK